MIFDIHFSLIKKLSFSHVMPFMAFKFRKLFPHPESDKYCPMSFLLFVC